MKRVTVVRGRIAALSAVLATALTVTTTAQAQAPALTEQAKLVGAGSIGTTIYQGQAVALSGDGNTALISGYLDRGSRGAVWVFTRDAGGTWTEQAKLVPPTDAIGAAPHFGSGIALSEDGRTALIGGPSDNSGVGATWVFTGSAGTWSEQAKLVGTGVTGATSAQGTTVALSADGDTALAGAPGDDRSTGAAWVFTRNRGAWTQQGGKLTGSGTVGAAELGFGAALSAHGNTALLSGYGDNANAGAAWVFTRSGGSWTQQGDKLVGSLAVGPAQQGRSAALSADGNTALVGGLVDNGSVGAVWVFTRSGDRWSQQQKLVGTGAAGAALQGRSVALSADGSTALIGGSGDNAQLGAAWMFTRSAGAWTQQGDKVTGSNADPFGGFVWQGWSAALSADASTALIGAIGDANFLGAAWVFVAPPPEMRAVKLSARDSVVVGEEIDFQLAAVNDGPGPAAGVVMTETLPDGFTLTGVEPSQGKCAVAGTTLTCTVGTIAASGGATVTLRGTAAAPGTLTNQMTVRANRETSAGNNVASATVTVTSPPPQPAPPPPQPAPPQPSGDSELVVGKRPDRRIAIVGERVRYAMTVRNAGTAATDDLIVLDLFSRGVAVVSAELERATCRQRRPIICRGEPVAPGETRTGTIVVRPLAPGVLRNAAAALGNVTMGTRSRVPLSDLPNLQVASLRVLAPRPRLGLRISPGQATRPRGGTVTHRLRVRARISKVATARVCYRPGAGLRIVRAVGASRAGRARCWTVNTLDRGRSRSFGVRVRVTGAARGDTIPVRGTASASNAARAHAHATVQVGVPAPAFTGCSAARAACRGGGRSAPHQMIGTP